MKSRDGVAAHQYVTLEATGVGPHVLLAAPLAGLQIAAYSFFLTTSGGGLCTFQDTAATILWRAAPNSSIVVPDADPIGLFTVGGGLGLNVTGVAGFVIRVNLRFEIRPIGI